MAFRVGQKVVCIKEYPCLQNGERFATEGCVYTIRGIWDVPDEGLGLYLVEVVNPAVDTAHGKVERPHPAECFRPAVERKTDISVFTKMLTDKVIEVSNA